MNATERADQIVVRQDTLDAIQPDGTWGSRRTAQRYTPDEACDMAAQAEEILGRMVSVQDDQFQRREVSSEVMRSRIAGEVVGGLVAVKPAHTDRHGNICWEFRCECGGTLVIIPSVARRMNKRKRIVCKVCRKK